MKKIVLQLLILVAVSAGLQAQSYTVISAVGKVEIRSAGGAWITLAPGDQLSVNDTISTGFGSRAVLEGAGARITIEPLTRMTVQELVPDSPGGSRTSLGLNTGRIQASVRRSEEGRTQFRVSSPVATAAVRGTEFGFNGYRVEVGEGTVNFTSGQSGGGVNVPRGGQSRLDENGRPVPVDIAAEENSRTNPDAVPEGVDPIGSPGDTGGSSGAQGLRVVIG